MHHWMSSQHSYLEGLFMYAPFFPNSTCDCTSSIMHHPDYSLLSWGGVQNCGAASDAWVTGLGGGKRRNGLAPVAPVPQCCVHCWMWNCLMHWYNLYDTAYLYITHYYTPISSLINILFCIASVHRQEFAALFWPLCTLYSTQKLRLHYSTKSCFRAASSAARAGRISSLAPDESKGE